MEGEADAEVKGIPPMSVGLNTLTLVATKKLKFRTFNNYSYEMDWINSPDGSRRKERTAILLKL